MFILENAEKRKKKIFFHIISTARNILMTILFSSFSLKYVCIFNMFYNLTFLIIYISCTCFHVTTYLQYNFSFWIEFQYIAVP